MFYFTPQRGFFSPFLRSTISLSVTQEYLALRGGPRRFTRDFTCPMLLGIRHYQSFQLLDFHHLWCRIQLLRLNFILLLYTFKCVNCRPPTTPTFKIGLGCSRFARRYYGNRFCFLFLRLLRCFNSPGCLFPHYEFCRKYKWLPNSGIFGSKLASSSPKRIAGTRALHRLCVPRSPPFALSHLTLC